MLESLDLLADFTVAQITYENYSGFFLTQGHIQKTHLVGSLK